MTWVFGTQGKFTWRMLATVLGGESLVVFLGALVARSIGAAQNSPQSGRDLALMCGLGVLCFLAAGLMRRPFGITLGWVVQALLFASATIVSGMLPVAVIFLALWVLCLVKGRQVDREQAARAAAAPA